MSPLFQFVLSTALLMGALPAYANTSATEMPQGLWEAFEKARHQVEPVKTKESGYRYWAQNPGNGLRIRFGEKGLLVESGTAGEDWGFAMQLAGYGQSDAILPAKINDIESDGDRVVFRRGLVEEWYVNRPAGLEQGFTLERPEGFTTDQSLVLSFEFSGNLRSNWQEQGEDIAFHTPGGDLAFTYNKLKAFDADGRALPASLRLADNTLEIHVEAGDKAAWPIIVDPIFSNQAKLNHSDNYSTGDKLGFSVDIYPAAVPDVPLYIDWVVVGAPEDDCMAAIDCGAVYVFLTQNNYSGDYFYSFSQRLSASDPTALANFGQSVAISGEAIVIGAPGKNGNAGGAYLFATTSLTWSEWEALTPLVPVGNVDGDDRFGWSVAADGDIASGGVNIAVGAYADEDGGNAGNPNGAVYLFKLNSNYTRTYEGSLVAGSGNSGDDFGRSMALVGPTLAVGAPVDSGAQDESVYIYLYDAAGWEEEIRIIAPTSNQEFGAAIALTDAGTDGDKLIVGAPATASGNGSAFAYKRKTGGKKNKLGGYGWDLGAVQTLTPIAALESGAGFGASVAVHKNLMIIGSPTFRGNWGVAQRFRYYTGSGWLLNLDFPSAVGAAGETLGRSVAVYVSDDTYPQEKTLYGIDGRSCIDGPPNCGAAHLDIYYFKPTVGYTRQQLTFNYQKAHGFGDSTLEDSSTALHGNTAAVAAQSDPCDNDAVDSAPACGAVYIFDRAIDGSWSQVQKVVPADVIGGDQFGKNIALSEDTLVVGTAQNSVYFFEEIGGTWSVPQKFSKPSGEFGGALDISGDRAIIGARYEYEVIVPGQVEDGAAYIYHRSTGGLWSEETRLVVLNRKDLGSRVAISGDLAAVQSTSFDGEVYIFNGESGSWIEEMMLPEETASYPVVDNWFGNAIDIDGERLVVGAGSNFNPGAAYVFEREGGVWPWKTTLLPADSTAADHFGASVSLKGDTVAIGSTHIDCELATPNCGAVYVFTGSGNYWQEQLKLDDGLSYNGHSVSLEGDTILSGINTPDDCDAALGCGAAYINRFDCSFGGAVIADRWVQIGIPCELGAAHSVDEVLGDNMPTAYGVGWIVYAWDPLNDKYQVMESIDPLEQGVGYWLLSLDDAVWDATGALTADTTGNPNCPSSRGCLEILLEAPDTNITGDYRYNMIGHPVNIDINWADVRIEVNGIDVYTPDAAFDNSLIEKTFYHYNGNGYDSFDACTAGFEGVLKTNSGFWVKALHAAHGNTVKLLIPLGNEEGCSSPAYQGASYVPAQKQEATRWLARLFDFFIPEAHAAQPGWEQEWYLRLTVEAPAEGLKDKNNVLGQLMDSNAGYDSHDLVELDPFSPPYLTIVFPHDDWGDNSGKYASDFHLAEDYYAADQWVFQVRSDDPYREINLRWSRPYLLEGLWSQDNGKRSWSKSKQADSTDLFERMWLEDMDSGAHIDAVSEGALQSFPFNMNGSTIRTFRWVLESHNGKPPKEPKKYPAAIGIEHAIPPGLEHMDQPPRPDHQ